MGDPRSQKRISASILDELKEGADNWTIKAMGQSRKLYLVTITPEMADRIIEHCNLRNRKVRQNKVLEFAGYMTEGKWQLREQIIISENGELIDGQHRILAVAEADHPIAFLLMVVQARHAAEVNRFTDIGTPRNLGDYLHFNGVVDAARVAPVLVYERNCRVSTKSPFQSAKGSKESYLHLYREIGEEKFKRAFNAVPPGLHRVLGLNRAFLDWFALRITEIDDGAAEFFLGCLHDPSQLKKTDPPFVLREALIKIQRESKKVDLIQQAHMTAKAWRLYGQNETASFSKIRHRINEDWPGIYGEEMIG